MVASGGGSLSPKRLHSLYSLFTLCCATLGLPIGDSLHHADGQGGRTPSGKDKCVHSLEIDGGGLCRAELFLGAATGPGIDHLLPVVRVGGALPWCCLPPARQSLEIVEWLTP
jgi:hypothetical protein